MNQFLAFLNLYQHAKNQLIPSVYFWDTVSLKFPWPDWPHSFLTMPTQKCFDQVLIFFNLYQNANNQLFHLFILQIQPILETRDLIGHTHFWPCSTKKFAINFLISLNFYQCTKNEAVSLNCSGEIMDLKTLQSDWLTVFWPIIQV